MAPSGAVALLLHLDALHPETLALDSAKVARVGGLLAHTPGAPDRVGRAGREAMADALARAAQHFGCDTAPVAPAWSDGLPVVTAWAPVGPSAETLPPGCLRVRRRWDDLTWPSTTRSHYQVHTVTPAVLREL